MKKSRTAFLAFNLLFLLSAQKIFSSPWSEFKKDRLLDFCMDSYLESLGKANAIAQIFLVNIEGDSEFIPVESVYSVTENPSDLEMPLVSGGVIFFSYNIAPSAEQIISFTDSITSYCTEHSVSAPYISVDQEGGLVNRLKDVTSYLPSAAKVSSKMSPEQSSELYASQARQMKA